MPGILCEHCTAACCQYVALPIETPDTREDFDDIRWYLIHKNVSVFIEDDEWFISFATACRHLQDDWRCGIYETRPKICRAYTTDNCDYHSGDYDWEQHFTAPEHLDAYVKEHLADESKHARHAKSARKRHPGRAAVRVQLNRQRPKRKHAGPAEQKDRAGQPLPVLPY